MSLYRKYRPATFAEVVGQDQVTRPLSAALDSGRINHAYLFSGPRGCGKTSSARILARSLNCVQGPTSAPCGVCPSCVSLAPGGPGNLDVTELDAASHRGVEDMRELRDRAYYAPAESRYRVFIIDEAHMITREGFNALLKIVEEPPEHLIFIFATTEPENVIGTIRSRTHHYPFRLLTPAAMRGLLERTVAAEGVFVEDSVYPLVIRAGGGSPRDSLSILDQLIAGSGPDGLTYDEAIPLLGVTDLSLIDATVDALAAADKPALFATIDDVIEAGIEPRRFVADLLDRLRDVMVLQAVPDALEAGLVEAPADRAEVLAAEAKQFTGARIAQLADQVNARMADLRGATSPRLLLEILCAHLLLVDAPAASAAPAAPAAAARPAQPVAKIEGAGGRVYERPSQRAAREARERLAMQKEEPAPAPAAPAPEPKPAPAPKPEPAPEKPLFDRISEQWNGIREDVFARNKVAGIMLAEAKVLGLDENTLFIGHHTGALAERLNTPANNEAITQVLARRFGEDIAVRCVVGTKDPVTSSSVPVVPLPRSRDHEAATPAPAPAGDDGEEPASDQPVWGKPRALGGGGSGGTSPAPAPESKPTPEPEPAPKPKPKPQPAESRFRVPHHAPPKPAPVVDDPVPLPPEPGPEDDFAPAPEEDVAPPYEAVSEEELAAREAATPGERDRRDAMTVATELLAAELGARPV